MATRAKTTPICFVWRFTKTPIQPATEVSGPLLQCRHRNCQPAAWVELRQVNIFLDGVDLVLPRPDGYGGYAMLIEPIGVEPAVGEHGRGLQTQRFHSPLGVLHRRRIVRHIER